MYRHYQNKERYTLVEAQRLLEQAFASAAELRRDCDRLPTVTPEGSSDCPFAEDVYYQKEETARFVRNDLEELKRYERDAAGLASLCWKKLDDLAQERARLNSEAPAGHVLEAEASLQNEVQQHHSMRKDLKEAILEVEATLREAEARRFPGREPRGPYGAVVRREKPKARPLEELRSEGVQDTLDNVRRISRKADADNE